MPRKSTPELDRLSWEQLKGAYIRIMSDSNRSREDQRLLHAISRERARRRLIAADPGAEPGALMPNTHKRPPQPSGVYVAKSGDFFKIGRSGNIPRRLRVLQTAAPHPVTLVASWTGINGVRVERELHARFADRRVTGEWFALMPDDLIWIAEYQPE